MKDANKLIFSPDDLAASLGVQRGTIYRWRKQGRLPQGFLLSPSNRRWHVNELARHSNELALAFSHCLDSTPTLSKDFVEDPNGQYKKGGYMPKGHVAKQKEWHRQAEFL